MLKYPVIDPIAVSIGPLNIYWYGLMYLLALLIGLFLAKYRVKKELWCSQGWNSNQVDDLITYAMFGVILGGRIGYVLFYDFAVFLSDPLEIFKIWNGGMSFHGGLIGVLLGLYLFSKKHKHNYLATIDFVAPLVPPGLFFGRIGNFINSELWGRVTDSPFGMVFPNGGSLARHPSQLYEAFLEGLVLFIVLWIYSSKKRAVGKISGLFALLYGVFRFSVEFLREPDAHLGFVALNFISMGQILSLPLIIIGFIFYFRKN